MAAITEGEVAIYDRQLRLWGVQAQQRLLKSKVLIWGLEGCNVEACKNLVLAGISLTVRDHRVVTKADVGFNYFLREEDVGKCRASCAAPRIHEMNPLSECKASEVILDEVSDSSKLCEIIKDYDVVCLGLGVASWDPDKVSAIDAACRKVGANFIISVGIGEMSFFFSNFHEHTVQERSSAQGGGAGSTSSAEAAAPETINFASFAEWLQCKPADLLAEKVDASVVLVSLFFAFVRHSGGRVARGDAAKFEEYCKGVANCAPTIDGIDTLGQAFGTFFVEPLMAVASIVGGLLAQEVIKSITKRDPPLVNTVCFNANTSAAMVERIPAEKKVAPKRKIEETFDLDD